MKKVFKISGKFQQYGRWSDLKDDFIGYFAKADDSDVFTGYMEEQYDSPSSHIRYIKGLYIEQENKIVFLQMTNDIELSPLFYTFPKSVFPNYSASIIFATMAVAVLMYSPMLNFFTTRTS